jgi:hypothetical protein
MLREKLKKLEINVASFNPEQKTKYNAILKLEANLRMASLSDQFFEEDRQKLQEKLDQQTEEFLNEIEKSPKDLDQYELLDDDEKPNAEKTSSLALGLGVIGFLALGVLGALFMKKD